MDTRHDQAVVLCESMGETVPASHAVDKSAEDSPKTSPDTDAFEEIEALRKIAACRHIVRPGEVRCSVQ